MATSNDHPGLPFVQAENYTRGRADGPPLWIVIHTMEAGENSQRAETTANYFANPPDGRQVSSHYCADNDSVVQCVDLDDTAWTVGNRPGNYRGLNWELSGFANQSRDQWLDPFSRAMLAKAVPLMRSDSQRFNIPVHRCSVADLQARRPGYTTHNDLRLAFGVTTHTDPGPNFPFNLLFGLIGGTGELDMFMAQVQGNPAIVLSTGLEYRGVPDFNTFVRLRDQVGVPLVIVPSMADLTRLCGRLAGPEEITLTPEQLQAVVNAASSGAEQGVDAALDGATITTTIETSDSP